MLEYPFFHPHPHALFRAFLDARQVAYECRESGDERSVSVADDLAEPLAAELEDYYDELLGMTEALVSDPASAEEFAGASIRITLADGRETLAVVQPGLLEKALRCLTPDEIDRLVEAVVRAVEHPDARSVCRRHRDAAG